MKARLWVLALAAGFSILAAGCSLEDDEYRVGRHYLDEQDNWKLASDFFRKSLRNHPDRWKTHAALIEALGRGDDPTALEAQLYETLGQFPDSARSAALTNSATQLIGENRYNQISGSLQLAGIQKLIAEKGDKPALLSRGIIAACRAADATVALGLLDRFFRLKDKPPLPDSVKYELDYFLGPAQIERAMLSIRLEQNPNDPTALASLARASLLSFDLDATRAALKKLASANSELLASTENARMYAALYNLSPFSSQIRTNGWDGCATADGGMVSIRDLGKRDDPDPYFYRGEAPIMKAGQQDLRAIAMPRFSPDGSWIYFYGSTEKYWRPGSAGRFQLYRIKPSYGSSPQKLTDEELIPTDFHIESGGSILVVRRDIGSVRRSGEVIRIDPAKKSVSSVVRIGEMIKSACFTPKGDSLLFISDRGLLKRALTGGQVVADLTWQGIAYPSLSPDGRWLLVHSLAGDQLLLDRLNGGISYLGSCEVTGGQFIGSSRLLVTRKLEGMLRVVEFDLNNPAVNLDRFAAAVKS